MGKGAEMQEGQKDAEEASVVLWHTVPWRGFVNEKLRK